LTSPSHHPTTLRCTGSFTDYVGPGGADVLLDSAMQWIGRKHGDLVESSHRGVARSGASALNVRLFPNAPALRLRATDDGTVSARSVVTSVGPGFSVFVARLLRQTAAALGITWVHPPSINPQRASELAQMNLMVAARTIVDHLSDDTRFPLLLLPDAHRYRHNGLVATPLGPRGMKWLAGAAVGALPLEAAFPWAHPGQRARAARGRALASMWTQVRWREPIDDAEQSLVMRIDSLLASAHEGEPLLDLPWAEWADIQDLAGITTEHSPTIYARAGRSTSWPPIGYRRKPVDVRLSSDWWIQVPGSLAETASGDRWIGVESGRRITVRVHTDPSTYVQPTLPRAARPLHHRTAHTHGRAWMQPNAPERPGHDLCGTMQSGDSVVSIRAQIRSPRDRSWAETAWRSLRQDVGWTAHAAAG
jgi:hypothetical protein